jgi:catechol 2,3-dioxygenase-like lactoylglutathione lyase family enzyme
MRVGRLRLGRGGRAQEPPSVLIDGEQRVVVYARAMPMDQVDAITLFVEDLAETKAFYDRVFAKPILNEDDESIAYRFENTIINLLHVTAAPELVAPSAVGDAGAGARFQLTVGVEDVDATCAELRAAGVTLLNGPVNRPWGPRTASFTDPSGHIWEIAS